MATKAKRHTHKYHFIDTGSGTKVWACALPDCNHHMPPHYARLVMGKQSICWGCGDTMVLDGQNMRMEQPVCIDCISGGFGEIVREKEDQFISDPLGTQARAKGKEIEKQGVIMCPVCKVNPKMESGNWCIQCVMSGKTIGLNADGSKKQ